MEVSRKSLLPGPCPTRTNRPGFEIIQVKSFLKFDGGNFAAPWPRDPKFVALKNLTPFKTVLKVQEPSSTLTVVFVLSNCPDLQFISIFTVHVSVHDGWRLQHHIAPPAVAFMKQSVKKGTYHHQLISNAACPKK